MCIEVFEILEPLANTKLDNGQVKIVRNGYGDTVLGCSIKFRDDDAIEVESGIELPAC